MPNSSWDTSMLSASARSFGGDIKLTLAGYNTGEQTVHRHGGISNYDETQSYVDGISRRLR